HAYARGLAVFNDATGSFEPLVRSGPDFLPFHNSGHALAVDVAGRKYYYFATQFPLSVRMRVRAEWDYIIDPNQYEVLTALKSNESPRWIRAGDLIDNDASQMPSLIKSLKKEKEDTYLYDVTSGKKVTPHGGSVYFNAWRNRWIMITVQQYGEPSFLGEVWYAEADTPVGPWAYARKIVTHNKYTFYNPMQHPYFDQNGGRVIYFEGTYANTFSGSEKNPTPRYDYNQMMYRLNLDDSRLALPVAVYQVRDGRGRREYLLKNAIEESGKWKGVESIPFCAVEPSRASDELVPVYANETGLTTKRPSGSAKPLFYALSKGEAAGDDPATVSLYEYRHAETEQRLYSTDPARRQTGWVRAAQPICRVWKAPPGPHLLDSEAGPVDGN
ncbi:MAG: hypothetical protein JSW47_16345, partial [Phycisphaerales bacterium]